MTVREEEILVEIKPEHQKAKGIAFILSLVPGGGYMYFGLMNRGLQTLLIFFGAIFLSSILQLGVIAGMVIPVLMLYTIFDTQQVLSELNYKRVTVDRGFWAWSSIGLQNPIAAAKFNGVHQEKTDHNPAARSEESTKPTTEYEKEVEPVTNNLETEPQLSQSNSLLGATPPATTDDNEVNPTPPQPYRKKGRRVILAYIFIGLGILALFNNLFPTIMMERYWRLVGIPVLLIGGGVLILYRQLRDRKEDERGE